LALGLSSIFDEVKTMGTGGLEAAVAPNLSRFSLGGGLDLVDLGFIFDDFFTVFSLLPPLIGLFNKVFKADSVLNSHFMMVSLTKKRKNIIAN
jgi:hypothetical protein